MQNDDKEKGDPLLILSVNCSSEMIITIVFPFLCQNFYQVIVELYYLN
jgi:hypothetical protein